MPGGTTESATSQGAARRSDSVLTVTLVCINGIALLYSIIGLIVLGARAQARVLEAVSIFAVSLFSLAILRRVSLKMAGLFASIGFWVVFTFDIWYGGRGVLGVGYACYVLPIVIMAFVFGLKPALATSVISSLSGAVVMHTQLSTAIDHKSETLILASWAGISVLFLGLASILGYAILKMNEAFEASNEDLEEKIQTEKRLTVSENRLRLSLEASQTGIWEWDLITNQVFWSDNLEEGLFKLPRGSFGKSYDEFLNLVIPEDRNEVLAAANRALESPDSRYHNIFRVKVDGEERWFEGSGRVFKDADGTPVRIAGATFDITDRQKAEQALEASEEKYRRLVDMSPDGVLVHAGGKVIFVNEEAVRIFGAKNPSELIGMDMLSLVHPDFRATVRGRVAGLLEGKPAPLIEEKLIRLDGSVVEVEVAGRPVIFNNVTGSQVIIRDLTDVKKARAAVKETEEKWRIVVQNVPDFITTLDPAGNILFINHLLPGWTMETVIGRPFFDFTDPQYHDRVREMLKRIFENGEQFEYEVKGSGSPGEERYYANRLIPIRTEDRITAALLVATDVTNRKRDVVRLEYQASHDTLTDLPNRQRLVDRCLQEIQKASEEDTQVALLILDLDRFKEINDTLGHYTGDLLLKRIGPRLSPYLQSVGAELSRLGGDEFAVLIPGLRAPAEAEAIAHRLHDLIQEPFQLEGMNLEVDFSVGISMFPLHGRDPISLLRCADVAMYIAKRRSTNVAMYSVEQDRYSRRRLSLLTELGVAIREDQLVLHYQPKLDLRKNKCVGVESLVRWMHPTHGIIPPGEFVPLAEMGNLIIPLTGWVVEEALSQRRKWALEGLEISVAVNLSVRSLMDDNYPQRVQDALIKYETPPHQLELEITESAIMADPERALVILGRLSALGIELSIDDFGTGYSSLSYLSRLPIQSLKIDLSFVRQMRVSERNTAIVNSTIRLAHTLGLRVIAEGVEDAATLGILADMKCDLAQGYFLGKPMPASEIPHAIGTLKTDYQRQRPVESS